MRSTSSISQRQHSSIPNPLPRTESHVLRICRCLCLLSLLCVAAAIPTHAQIFSTIFAFNGTDGSTNLPSNTLLVQGLDGNLYGTTSFGGANNDGTVFKITPKHVLTTLYSFCSQPNCADGRYPLAGLVLASDGNFYGTTQIGGAINASCPTGCGTTFKITSQGALTTLYDFCVQTNCADGSFPAAAPIQATDGNFYGTTVRGGAKDDGTVFKITPEGILTTLYTFCSVANCADGTSPNPVVQATDGNFYGTTFGGSGTVFRMTPTGTLTTLYTFCSLAQCDDGNEPDGALVQASDGNLYGATSSGGPNTVKAGTVFKLTLGGTVTTVYGFCSQPNCGDGARPGGALSQGTDGNFYGTTNGQTGVAPGLFRLTLAGSLTVLHSFAVWRLPEGLVQDTDGSFYGMTTDLPSKYHGIIFRESVGLGRFVETLPSFGAAGTNVTILGTSLTGATAVTFNGTPATFAPVSASEITATVPAGAATGTVRVTTTKGTLSSNVVFTIP